MPRRCTVCDHPERLSIDEALVSGAPYRSVAKRFGLSESAVYRHKTDHLPAHLLKAKEVEEAARADDLLEQVKRLQSHALDILERAKKAGDLRTALAAISQARGNLELLGKLAGELDERPGVNLNVSPEWLELQRVALILTRTHHACTIGRVGLSAEPSVRIRRYRSITLKSAVRAVIVKVLEPHPAVHRAVLRTLESVGNG